MTRTIAYAVLAGVVLGVLLGWGAAVLIPGGGWAVVQIEGNLPAGSGGE